MTYERASENYANLLALSPGHTHIFNVTFLCVTLKNWEWSGDEATTLSEGASQKICNLCAVAFQKFMQYKFMGLALDSHYLHR